MPGEYQTIPLEKIEDFGVHCKQSVTLTHQLLIYSPTCLLSLHLPPPSCRYYSLEVSYFKSSLDSHLLDLLWNKYWVNTLSSCSMITVGFSTKQLVGVNIILLYRMQTTLHNR